MVGHAISRVVAFVGRQLSISPGTISRISEVAFVEIDKLRFVLEMTLQLGEML